MKLQNELGEIRISADVFTAITGSAATNCYGVKGMAVRSKTDGLVHLLKRESMSKGVKVYYNEDGTVSIELHIIVENGVNLMAVGENGARVVENLFAVLQPLLTEGAKRCAKEQIDEAVRRAKQRRGEA